MRKYTLDDLLYLMERLREPAFGCPWDRKQDFSSIVPYTLEECYEVIDAIENKDWAHLSEELGDLLFQIIFYAQLADEQKLFDMSNVIDGLVTKLIRRHPHVFLDQVLESKVTVKLSGEEIAASWDAIKAFERAQKNNEKSQPNALLDDVPKALPALLRADKLQKRAAKVGFDWDDINDVFAKVEEELAELKEAIALEDKAHVFEEMGDFLFSQVNLARHLKINPEDALRKSNQKFINRFNYVEKQVVHSEKQWQQHTLFELDDYWKEAKKQGL